MAEAITDTCPNLYQLGVEVGGAPGFRCTGPHPDGTYVVRSDEVPADVLEAAVAAHDPDPAIVPPPAPGPPAEPGLAAARAAVADAGTVRELRAAMLAALDLLAAGE